MSWAWTQLRGTIWAYRCERFVEEAYGTRYQFSTAWVAARRLLLHREPVNSAPAGTLVYFGPDSVNHGYGHVGLSLGRGRMLSALDTVRITNVGRSRYWSGLYRGWAAAPDSWPGRIPPPPGPTGPLVSSDVHITAPESASTVSGVVALAASARNVGGVAFEAYYATDPKNSQTVAWHMLGNGTPDADGWTLAWNTSAVPDQGNVPWGTVSIAAIALDRNGRPTGTRNYRRISVENGSGSTTPPGTIPTTPTIVAPPGRTYAEQEGHLGVNTFTDYHLASGLGPKVPPMASVQVSCKVHDTTIASVNPDGYWYRIASAPWSDRYYSPANTFYNGDSVNGLPTHNTDFGVPDC